MTKFSRVKRILWGMSSQVFASSISLALTIFTARSVSAVDYGVFSLALTSAFFVTGLIRALTSEVLVFRHSSATGEQQSLATSACLSASAVLGLSAALVTLMIGMVMSSALWMVVAAALIGLVLQDNVRFVLMAHGRTGHASLLDASALAATIGFLVLASFLGDLLWFVCAWGAAAWFSAFVGLFLLKTRLSFANAKEWIAVAGGQPKFFAGDFLLTNVVSTGAVYFIALLLGAVAAGQIRAASMLVLPILLLTRGVILALAAESNRLIAKRQFRSVRNLGILMSASSVLVTVVWIPVVELLPLDVLAVFLGDSAQGASDVFPYVALATAAAGLAAGPNLILKSAGRVRTTLLGKIVVLPIAAGGVILLSLSSGVAGSQLGLVLGEVSRTIWATCWVGSWLRKESVSIPADVTLASNVKNIGR